MGTDGNSNKAMGTMTTGQLHGQLFTQFLHQFLGLKHATFKK